MLVYFLPLGIVYGHLVLLLSFGIFPPFLYIVENRKIENSGNPVANGKPI
jgi:hypothetical protein